jgi:hypothetical protein
MTAPGTAKIKVAEIDHRFRCDLRILGNTELWCIEVRGGDTETIEALLAQPLTHQTTHQPLPPEDLQPHAKHQLQDGDDSGGECQRQENHDRLIDEALIALLERVEE